MKYSFSIYKLIVEAIRLEMERESMIVRSHCSSTGTNARICWLLMHRSGLTVWGTAPSPISCGIREVADSFYQCLRAVPHPANPPALGFGLGFRVLRVWGLGFRV